MNVRLLTSFAPSVPLALVLLGGVTTPLGAGQIFLSGHDPDFHASLGGNAAGAQTIIQDALAFARNGNTAPILLLETSTANNVLGDHTDSETGLMDSGYSAANTPGNHYVKLDDAQFATANLSLYSAIFVPSDHGGTLTGDDLAALDARQGAIAAYLNAGGGLVAFAEDGFHTPATNNPQPPLYGFLPFPVGSGALEQSESGYTLTPFGQSLGLTNADINGNASHGFFTSAGPLKVVDTDPSGHVISIAGTVGAVPEPSSLIPAGLGIAALIAKWRTRPA